MRWLTLLVCLGVLGCKSQGTGTVDIDFGTCTGRDMATEVRVYLIAGGTCAGCECGGCFDLCNQGNCTLVCEGGNCSVAEVESGLSFEPPEPGLYAVLFDYSYPGPDGVALLGASACAEVVVDADGTDDFSVTAQTACCSGASEPDGGR